MEARDVIDVELKRVWLSLAVGSRSSALLEERGGFFLGGGVRRLTSFVEKGYNESDLRESCSRL